MATCLFSAIAKTTGRAQSFDFCPITHSLNVLNLDWPQLPPSPPPPNKMLIVFAYKLLQGAAQPTKLADNNSFHSVGRVCVAG